MLGDLKDKAEAGILNLEGGENGGQVIIELDVDDGTNDRANLTNVLLDLSGLVTDCNFPSIRKSATNY